MKNPSRWFWVDWNTENHSIESKEIKQEQLNNLMETTQRNAEELARIYEITEDDLKYIRSLQKKANQKLPELVDRWYKWLSHTAEYEEHFSEAFTLERVHNLQLEFWRQFFMGEITDSYIETRQRVGEVHAKIGLSLEIYLAGVDHFLGLFVDMLSEMKLSNDEFNASRRALNKMTHLDMTIIVQSFERVINEKIAAQSKSLISMSTPVTQIWSGLLLLPVVGLIDSRRAQEIMDNTLNMIAKTHAQCLILDISGVAVVDTAVANHLIKITKATSLMGCVCVISGLSPAIAQTIVELGIEVGDIRTTANLKSAIEIGFSKLNMMIVEKS
jgi:rsbT co-antagonist protein RsbR